MRNCNRGISSSVIETQFISFGEWIGRLIALIISQSSMSDKEQKISSRWHQTDRKNYESISILPQLIFPSRIAIIATCLVICTNCFPLG